MIRIGKRRIVKRSHCEHRPPLHWDGQSWFWSSIAVRLASQFFVNPYTKLNVSQSRSWCVPRCILSAGGATCTSEKPARIFRRGLCPPVCRPFLRQTGGRHNGHNGLNRHNGRTGTDRLVLVLVPVGPADLMEQLEGQLQTFMVLLWLQSQVSFVCLCVETFNCLNFKLVYTFRSEANHSTKMREIVHVQAGQCGNQIGAKFWEIIR